jgi:exosortase
MGTALLSIKDDADRLKLRHVKVAAWGFLAVCVFHGWLAAWLRLAWHDERYSHLLMIPLISAVLLYGTRREVFAAVATASDGVYVATAGALVCAIGSATFLYLGEFERLFVVMLGLLTFGAGVFRFYYGRRAWRTARFPIAFSLFMVPVPGAVLERCVHFLQNGSALVVEGLMTMLQVSYLRDGLRFAMPGLQIEIAKECSGIRSSIAMLILVVLMAHFSLRSWWRKLLLVASIIPLVLFKNGLRIVTLSWLAIKVDPGFITGSLHHRGGFVFFGLTFLLVFALNWALQRWEAAAHPPALN